MPGVVGSSPEAGEFDNLIVEMRGRGERENGDKSEDKFFFSYSFSNNSRLYQNTKIKSKFLQLKPSNCVNNFLQNLHLLAV